MLRDAIFEHILFLHDNFYTCISLVIFDREHKHGSSNSYLPKCYEKYKQEYFQTLETKRIMYILYEYQERERAEVHKRKVFVLCRSCFFVLQIKVFFLRLIKSFLCLSIVVSRESQKEYRHKQSSIVSYSPLSLLHMTNPYGVP